MVKGKTLYVSDLDGTLLNRNAALSEYTENTLNKLISGGINFTVATGRTTDAAKKIMADIGLNLPIITFNGAVIYDVGQKRAVKVYRLEADTVKEIIRVFKTHGISGIMYELKDDLLTAYHESLEQNPLIDAFVKDRRAKYNSYFCQVGDFDGVSSEHIMYFTTGGTYDHVKPVYDALKGIPGINISMVNDTYGDKYWFLEVFSAGASKQSAVSFFRGEYGYEKIIGFGDNQNDLPMFGACDVRVAVDNAIDGVKAAADHICASRDDDGVVKWIESNIYMENSDD